MRRRPLLFAAALALLAGCQSPLASPDKGALQPGQTKLIFQVGASRALDLTSADYLTLQLTSSDGSETRFSSASGGGSGTFSLVVDGLTSGDWHLKVRMFPTSSSTNLLYYANLTHYVEAGRSNTVNVDLYPAATIDGVGVAEAVNALTVDVEDLSGDPWSARGYHHLIVGQEVQLKAEVLGPANVPASDQRVLWHSSDETILMAGSQGLLKALTPGVATLTVTSVVGKKASTYQVSVGQGLVGHWVADVDGPAGTLRVAQLTVEPTASGGLEATLWTGLGFDKPFPTRREETGPLFSVGRSTSLFTRQLTHTNFVGSEWLSSTVYDSTPATLTQISADAVVFEGPDRSRTGSQQVQWEFRRSTLRIDSFDAPLPPGAVKPAFVGQPLDLDVVTGQAVPTSIALLWTTSDPTLASVNPSSGEVSFLGQGRVTIRAQATGSLDQVFKVVFDVQAPLVASSIAGGITPSDKGALSFVVADTLSGLGGWFVSGVGSDTDATRSALLARFDVNGTWDTSFGSNGGLADADGLAQTGVVQMRNGARTAPGLLQNGGQIHWLTTYTSSWGSAQYRFSPNGALDGLYADDSTDQAIPSFRAKGAPVANSLGDLFVVGQRESDGRTVIKQLTPVLQDFWVATDDATTFRGDQIAVLPDDSFVMVVHNSSGTAGRLIRLTSSGTLDTSFGTSGAFTHNNGLGEAVRHYSAVRVVGNQLYLVGWDWLGTTDPRYLWQDTGLVLRLNLDGSFDSTFAPGKNLGYQTSAHPPQFVLRYPYRRPADLAVGPDGRIVIVGQTFDNRAFAVRLEANASGVDRSLGGIRHQGDGLILDQGTPGGSGATSVAIDAQNRVAIAGWVENAPAFWRF